MITKCPHCETPSPDGMELLRCPKCHYTKEFMDYAEFGKLIGVSGLTVRRLEKSGKVEVRHIGRIARIHRTQYDVIMGLA
jgi:uncharacterized C2H2 Zn-finger protein